MTGPEGLADPFGKGTTIETDFLHLAVLKGVITDSHFTQRERLGRLFAFVAKAQASRPADAPPLIGVGVDETVSLAVEPDGTGRVYASLPDTGVWVVYGDRLPRLKTPGPLVAQAVHVTGAGPDSRILLPSGAVDKPSFQRDYTASGGTITQTP
jgi:beta-aspartyl-peptidase (threonine type)